MSWLIMSLRRSELQKSISDHTYEKLEISRQMRKLSSFSNSIGDGTITPSEIASLGSDLFGDALDFMQYANESASQVAQTQTDYYAGTYESITQEQYYNNPNIASQAQLYYDENGQLDTETMYSEFYEEALKEFATKYFQPYLKEKEEEMENKKTELETLVEAEQAELEQLKNSISTEIQNNTIKLS